MSLRSIVEVLLPDFPALGPEDRRQVVARSEAFVTRALSIAPFHVRLGAGVLGALLRIWLRLHPGSRAELALARFQRMGSPFAAIVRLFRTLIVLAFYEHPIVERALGLEVPEDRRAHFVALRSRLAEGEVDP